MKWHRARADADFLDWLAGQCPESSADADDIEPEEPVPDRGTIIDESVLMLAELRQMAA